MKIDRIQNNYFIKQVQQGKFQTEQQINKMKTKGISLTASQYLAFTGGYSLNLAQTVRNLDKLAEKNPQLYPPNIRHWLSIILEGGNKTNETLITAHKKYFASLEDCFSLNDIKTNFPEFENVISSRDVVKTRGKDSLLDKFERGELEYFDNDEDLSVQLIKLYWGKGYSLNDLRRYADGSDLYYTMKKLEIPVVSRDYGHVLKFSDPEYNERLIAEMNEKRLAALDRRAQESEGEPVYIKRYGHLTPEHKQHISEGLIKYYQDNPERIYEMSERQKKFLKDNPERAEIFTSVVRMAWTIFNGPQIKKQMSKFFERHGIRNFDPSMNPAEVSKSQRDVMKMFWGQNEWAKKSFSKNMKHAWKKVQENENKFYEIDITPNGFKKKFFLWAQEKGIDISKLDFKFRISKKHPEQNTGMGNILSQYTTRFIDDYTINNQSTVMANSYYLALLNSSAEIKKYISKHASDDVMVTGRLIRMIIREMLFEPGIGVYRKPRNFDANEVQDIYRTCILTAMSSERPFKFLQIFENNLNKAYEVADNTAGKPLAINEYMMKNIL